MGVQIAWKDGLPDDPLERAQIEQILTESGLSSKYSAIKRLRDGDDEEAQAEIQRILEEEGLEAARQAAAMAAQGNATLAEEDEEQQEPVSRSSKAVMAQLQIDRGQNVKGPGRRG
jgi:hypothetical protein